MKMWFTCNNTVDDLKFLTIVACQKGLDKQSSPRSDCFWRSSLITDSSVCYSAKHFLNFSPNNQYFIWYHKEKSVWNFWILLYYLTKSLALVFPFNTALFPSTNSIQPSLRPWKYKGPPINLPMTFWNYQALLLFLLHEWSHFIWN